MYSPRAAIAFLLTFSFLSFMASISCMPTSLSATSFSMTVECLIRRPMTEHSLILIYGVLIVLSIFTNKFINAEFIRRFETFELTTIDSK